MAGSGGERGGVQPPAQPVAARDLQPEDPPADSAPPVDLAATGAALTVLHHNGFAGAERVEAEWAEDRLARLQADRELVERLQEDGFDGEEYGVFKAALASYGYPVLLAWIRCREIYRLTYEIGRPVKCSDELKEHLSRDADDRQELAMEVVARALVHFRERALMQGTWDPAGGASLTTFFVGAAVQVFSNVFTVWSRQYYRGRDQVRIEDVELDDRLDDDPADRVCMLETFLEALASAGSSKNPERLRYALAARLVQDAQYREIAEDLGATADTIEQVEDAIKKQVYRWREKQHVRRGRTDD